MADTTTTATSGLSGLNYVKSGSSSNLKGSMSVDTETFLKLLVAQMQYQDPLEPQSNTEFVTQLAQMSSMEQMQALNSSASTTKALDMVGKNVYAEVLDSQTGSTNVYSGVVEGVVMKSGTAYVVVGKNAICADDIIAVAEAGSSTDTTGTTGTTGTTTDTTSTADTQTGSDSSSETADSDSSAELTA